MKHFLLTLTFALASMLMFPLSISAYVVTNLKYNTPATKGEHKYSITFSAKKNDVFNFYAQTVMYGDADFEQHQEKCQIVLKKAGVVVKWFVNYTAKSGWESKSRSENYTIESDGSYTLDIYHYQVTTDLHQFSPREILAPYIYVDSKLTRDLIIDGLKYEYNSDSTLRVVALDKDIKSISIPSVVTDPNRVQRSVTQIDSRGFYQCKNLTSITIPNTIKSIGSYAFGDCTSLSSLTLPGTCTIGAYAFANCTFKPLNIVSDQTTFAADAFTNFLGDVLAYESQFSSAVKNGLKSTSFYSLDKFSIVTYIQGFKVLEPGTDNPYVKSSNMNVEVENAPNAIFSNEDGILVKNLYADWAYNVNINCLVNGNQLSVKKSIKTAKPIVSNCKLLNSTKTTLTIQVGTASTDITAGNPKISVERYPYEYSDIKDGTITLDNLKPGTRFDIRTVAIYNDNRKFYSDYIYPSTRDMGLDIQAHVTSSSIEAIGTYDADEVYVTNTELKSSDASSKDALKLTGLTPGSTYNLVYNVWVQGAGKYSITKTFTTEKLVMTTLQPKVINDGNVIIAAKTNLDDDEVNVGFEWRRIDWDDLLQSNNCNAYLYEGKIEGYIRNLNSNYQWKYRPFYTDKNDCSYYGDWVGVDPSNTSYFEPTVHTYDKAIVGGNIVKIKGYALRGTDNIKSQGFLVWTSNAEIKSFSTKSPVERIEAKGQIMEIELENLNYDTTYYYQAYVETDEEEILGEVRSFKTDSNPDGIEVIESKTADIRKFYKDGKLIIVRNGVKYNLNGMVIN